MLVVLVILVDIVMAALAVAVSGRAAAAPRLAMQAHRCVGRTAAAAAAARRCVDAVLRMEAVRLE